MRFFFSSRKFKVILSVLIFIVTISVFCIIIGGRISPQSDILGTVAAPFKAVFTELSNAVSDFAAAYTEGNEIMLKNIELENEISELRKRLAEYDKLVSENEFYKGYLEIKDNNPDFKFKPATVISRDSLDPYKGFVINRGSLNGIEVNDPVITDGNLVGFIDEVGLTTSKVVTLLSTDISLGVLDNRTSDSGVLSGSLELAEKGRTKFSNLSRASRIAVGDYVLTSGEGIFPEGLLVGTIAEIGNDEYNTSIYAAVEPFADIDSIRNVMVITEFNGQGQMPLESGN